LEKDKMVNIKVGSQVMVMVAGGALVLGEVTGICGNDVYVYLFRFEKEVVLTPSQLKRWN
jgi:hypothetical protein